MTQPTRVTQTVILAAGSGSRLATTRGDVPKPLMTVAGIPLIAHALDHARASGCEEAVIVIGYDGSRVREAVEAMHSPLRVLFLENPDYTAPNGVSLLASEPAAAPAFYLQMVDHLFCEPALVCLSATPLGAREAGRVLVDSAPSADIDLDDATKVQLAGARVTAIGKRLDTWDAIDAGCFMLTHAVFEALRSVPASEGCTVSSGMRRLVAQGALGSVDLRGAEWVDVDTPADREIAERLLTRRQLASERP
jgi:choline kinase